MSSNQQEQKADYIMEFPEAALETITRLRDISRQLETHEPEIMGRFHAAVEMCRQAGADFTTDFETGYTPLQQVFQNISHEIDYIDFNHSLNSIAIYPLKPARRKIEVPKDWFDEGLLMVHTEYGRDSYPYHAAASKLIER